MSQVRKHGSDAERQAAYRQRQLLAKAAAPKQSLPAMPALPSMPGTPRWTAALNMAHRYAQIVAEEMQAYHDDRSDRWQESERGEGFIERLEQIEQIAAELDDARTFS